MKNMTGKTPLLDRTCAVRFPDPRADYEWPVVVGCTPISEGCAACFGMCCAEVWFGDSKLHINRSVMNIPLNTTNMRVAVAMCGDLFHKLVSTRFIHEVVDIIERTPTNDYIVSTRRPSRMLSFFNKRAVPDNVVLCVSCENQKWLDNRVPKLMDCGCRRNSIAVEPMLGPISIKNVNKEHLTWVSCTQEKHPADCMGEIIIPDSIEYNIRPRMWEWYKNLKSECASYGVTFYSDHVEDFRRLDNHI